ncbi:MAG TPA: L-histidine N(alpha)-methyltransferase [Terriglobia bacterium]|jgi:dimethylhistidine N-methyltransferase
MRRAVSLPGHPIELTEFESDVRAGLSKAPQKELYSKYFYDDLGTALFEAITLLPEYGLTRADMRLLRMHAAELPSRVENVSVVVELGSGSGEKALEVLPHFVKNHALTYCPIDVSAAALTRCERDLDHLENLNVVPIEHSYIEGLTAASQMRIPGARILVLFLGSSIGNFEPAVADKFLKSVRQSLHEDDAFLLSADLVKPHEQMLQAYDDEIGLTAAFNFNLLSRINRELAGTFSLRGFAHEARYNESEQRIEMHLRAKVDQIASIKDFTISLKKDETIWTESSYKFRPEQIGKMAEKAGFRTEVQWIDAEWPFAQTLLRAV